MNFGFEIEFALNTQKWKANRESLQNTELRLLLRRRRSVTSTIGLIRVWMNKSWVHLPYSDWFRGHASIGSIIEEEYFRGIPNCLGWIQTRRNACPPLLSKALYNGMIHLHAMNLKNKHIYTLSFLSIGKSSVKNVKLTSRLWNLKSFGRHYHYIILDFSRKNIEENQSLRWD